MTKVLLGLLGLCALGVAAPMNFYDDFNSPVLDPAWSTSPGQGAYSLTARPGYLRYEVTGSTHPSGPALHIFRPFDGTDWILETQVDYTFGSGNGRQQFFTVHFGNSNESSTSRLTWFRTRDDFGGGPVSGEDVAAALDGGVDGPFNRQPPISPGETHFLRIVRQDQTLIVFRSSDGANYENYFTYTYSTPLGNEQVLDLYAFSFSSGQQAIADYNFVRLVPEPGVFGMALLGLGSLLWQRRRQRR